MSSLTLSKSTLNSATFTNFTYIVIATIYGLWNLDFFTALYHPECISPHINFLQSSLIDCANGLYPLMLVAVLYTFVTLRDRGCKIIIQIWKPFHYLLARFQSRINLLQFKRPTAKLGLVIALILSRKSVILEHT